MRALCTYMLNTFSHLHTYILYLHTQVHNYMLAQLQAGA